MNSYIDEIDVWKQDPKTGLLAQVPPPEPSPPSPAPPPPPPQNTLQVWILESVTWLVVAILLAGGGFWGYRAGMDLRHRLWIDTRSIRFLYDISNGYGHGNQAMRQAEAEAHLPNFSDALADQTPKNAARFRDRINNASRNGTLRRLTYREVFEGIIQYYNRLLIQRAGTGDYQLDYPPLRLTSMTLWVRYTEHQHPEITGYPGKSKAIDGYSAMQIEDTVTQPMLMYNTICSGVAAVAMFFLVWVWTMRAARSAAPTVFPKFWTRFGFRGKSDSIDAQLISPPKPPHQWIVPHGLLAFVVATAAFWYAFDSLIGPPLRPAPVVQLTQTIASGDSVTIKGTVNSQSNGTRWRIDWGTSEVYEHSTPSQNLGGSQVTTPISIKLSPVPPNQPLHIRLRAVNAGGVTNSDDVELDPPNLSANLNLPRQGGIDWPDWTVWIRMLVLFIAMVYCARQLPLPHRGWACGFVAAMLVWFNPLTLGDSIAWPQWDVWILPFFVIAMLLTSLEWWLAAGLFLGVGCMFKGQLLLGMPIFILWPLVGGRIGATLRMAIGISLGAGFIVWPWLITPEAVRWIRGVLIAAGSVSLLSLLRPTFLRSFHDAVRREPPPAPTPAPTTLEDGRGEAFDQRIDQLFQVPGANSLPTSSGTLEKDRGESFELLPVHTIEVPDAPPRHDAIEIPEESATPPKSWQHKFIVPTIAAVTIAAVTITASILIHKNVPPDPNLPKGLLGYFLLSILILPWLLPRKALGYFLAGVLAASLWIAPNLYGSQFTWSWLDIGFEYGTVKHEQMAMGSDAFANLDSMLNDRFRWNLHDTVGNLQINWPLFHIQSVTELDLKTCAVLIYGFFLILSAIAAAIHSRRNDPRLVAAVLAPWIIFPVVVGQMSERYLVWGSAASAVLIVISTRGVLLHAIMAIFTAGMISCQLLREDTARWPQVYQFFKGEYPHAGWMMMVLAGLFLIVALVPSRRLRPSLSP